MNNNRALIPRRISGTLAAAYDAGDKVLILYGPRQSGKTTSALQLFTNRPDHKVLSLTGDDPADRRELSSKSKVELSRLTAGYDSLFIDEAQRIPDIGITLKLLHDNLPSLRILATGSSSFELAARTKEALTGRNRTFTLHPIGAGELAETMDLRALKNELSDYLVHGMYPAVRTADSRNEQRQILKELTDSYLYKDVIEYGGIRHTDKIHDLLRLLSFQIGSEVSISELGGKLGLSRDTVDRYIDVLEMAFVVFRLRGYSRNLRKEVTKMDKIFFYDVGVRNMIIGNLAEPEYRNDMGCLWENFLVSERRKVLSWRDSWANAWFWRLRTGAELDYIEEEDGLLRGYEFKFGNKTPGPPASWTAAYPEADYTVVNRDNWTDFIL
ncbi:MAG: AAA family ATPase [Spirochaetes bacterium]|nr:MAG: AAA family ATPase [Spirochaetota bacterium]RKX73571.1 MAG: AAA family ATPase [Spirochaetota bacterium]RKX87019.1 MAG: AAA family ATPase [Spirochaetota bacterium]